jgi:diguanylate cyclase (GGDEF)-like protein
MATDGGWRAHVDFSFLRSRVARRVFALFVVAALAPIIVTAILVFTYVRGELLDDATRRLAEQCKNYGLERFSRLQQAAAILEKLTKSAADPRADLERGIGSLTFARLTVGREHAPAEVLIGNPIPRPELGPFELRWIEQGNTLVATRRTETGSMSVLLLRRTFGEDGERLWIAEVDPEFLWETVDQPADPVFAVIDMAGNLLFATQEPLRSMSQDEGQQLLARQRGASESVIHKEDTIFSSWRIFMRPTFGISGWTAVVVTNQASALEPLTAFRRIYPSVLAATILVVVLVSLIQIRRSHRPLERIVEGTRRLAARDFGSPIDVRDGTEYAELAAAFNEMTTRIERQFVALRTLADVDRLMLASQSIDPVLETILAHMRRILGCREVAIALTDREVHDVGRIYRLRDESAGVSIERTTLESDVLQPLLEHRPGLTIERAPQSQTDSPYLRFVSPATGTTTQLVPIIPALSVAGAVIAVFDASEALDDDARAFLRDTADRLAVALANDDRQRALIRQAHYDGLTGLPNRELFRDRLDQELMRAAREGRMVALLFIDLDRFKHVNDSTGHSTGDKLLRIAAARLRASVRDSDTVARLGGDEFIVILPNVSDSRDAARTADLILARLAEPFLFDGLDYVLSASIGIACSPGDGQTSEQLLKCADMAMYRAKTNGRGSYAFFEEQMNTVATQRLLLESQLRRAIDAGELELHYQPQVNLLTGRVVAAEALVRWRHPTMGLVPPGHFIPLAEDSGLILQIGEWVIREALAQLREWRMAGVELAYVAVNAATRQLRSVEFADRVLRELERSATPGQSLELEVTESGLMEDVESVVERLTRLRARGVRIAIDDFGTGYSSLYYLRDLPFDAIKIDRSFLKNIIAPDGAAIADAVIAMAHALGKQVVAEGVEVPAQLTYLRTHGCDLAQGYHFGRPVPAAEFAEMFSVARSGHGTAVAASA